MRNNFRAALIAMAMALAVMGGGCSSTAGSVCRLHIVDAGTDIGIPGAMVHWWSSFQGDQLLADTEGNCEIHPMYVDHLRVRIFHPAYEAGSGRYDNSDSPVWTLRMVPIEQALGRLVASDVAFDTKIERMLAMINSGGGEYRSGFSADVVAEHYERALVAILRQRGDTIMDEHTDHNIKVIQEQIDKLKSQGRISWR